MRGLRPISRRRTSCGLPPACNANASCWPTSTEALRFPDYFGWNWDALEECSSDLSWLAEPRRVVLLHADLPFAPRGRNRGQYLALLHDLVADNPAVIVVFPRAVKAEVARLVAHLAPDA